MGPFLLLIFSPLGATVYVPSPVYGGHTDRTEISFAGPRAVGISFTGPRRVEISFAGPRAVGMVPHD
jgi:hypothetical protein